MASPIELPTTIWLLIAVFAPLITGLLTMRIPRKILGPRFALAALGPILSIACVLIHLANYGVARVGVGTEPINWLPSLNLNIAFYADGLAAFFALLVSGIGLLIVLYARAYFGQDKDDQYRFYPTLGFFTTAMMGIVLADYMLLTLLFWEMTSISSFFLIGWFRYDKYSVKMAMQAFFTTGLGGMSLLGGILLFGAKTGIWQWSEFGDYHIESSPMIITAFCMMLAGAATKSAQWPWHYWLPGAMVAPTPVSTFLHSATMVKAGIYLTARMYPAFHGLEIWPWVILIPGAITMLMGAYIALNQHDLKRIFAYTTVSQLGLLMCAYGLGALSFEHGGHHIYAIDWDITQIANHALYKAPLFIIAGAIAHVAGTRDLPKLFGFWRVNKPMVFVMLLAGYALAGGPGTISFPAKELFFYAIYHATEIHWIFYVLAVMGVLTAVCNVAIFIRLLTTLMGWKFGLRDPSLDHAVAHAHGHSGDADDHHHEVGLWAAMLWIPAAVLVVWQYVGGIFPNLWSGVFRGLETNFNYEGFAERLPFVWELHFNMPLVMSLIAFALGIGLGISPLMRGAIVDVHDKVYPFLYWLCVSGGGYAFRTVQTGHFRHYLIFILLFLIIAFAGSVYIEPDMLNLQYGSLFEYWPGLLLGIVICATALMMPIVQKRVVRVLVLGACGFSVVGMYLVYQAPDLALTQLMFELISVILFVLVLRMLPKPDTKKRPSRWWRFAIGAGVGIAAGWMTLLAANSDMIPVVLGPMFEQLSAHGSAVTNYRGGGGNNIVNVVLVDFRGFDTLGEITVLSIAALGVWSLLPGRNVRKLEHSGRKI